jgi:hypothetical protein
MVLWEFKTSHQKKNNYCYETFLTASDLDKLLGTTESRKSGYWIDLAQDVKHWLALVNTDMKHRFLYATENILINQAAVTFSRRTLHVIYRLGGTEHRQNKVCRSWNVKTVYLIRMIRQEQISLLKQVYVRNLSVNNVFEKSVHNKLWKSLKDKTVLGT